jgi:hypothetical protein
MNASFAPRSNGGILAVQHVHDHPETPALVLLSAIAGGANSSRIQNLG